MRTVVIEDEHFGVTNRVEAAIVGDVAIGRIGSAQVVEQVRNCLEQRLTAVLVSFVLDCCRQVGFPATDKARQYQPALRISREVPGFLCRVVKTQIGGIVEILEATIAQP